MAAWWQATGVNAEDPSTYDDDYIRKRVKSGKDANRARTADELAAKARAGDQAALQQLLALSDVDGPGGAGWATPDARNYGRLVLRDMGIDLGGYQERGDGGGFAGSVGDVLKKAAPAAALIPGVGPLAAAGIAAAANSGGSLLQGKGLDLGGSLKDAALSYGGAKLLGGQGYKGISGVPGKLGIGGGTSARATAGTGAAGAADSGGGGLFGTGIGMDDVQKYAPLVLGGAQAINQAGQQGKANDLRDQAVGTVTQDWQSRAPLRAAAMTRAMAPLPTRPNLSAVFEDKGNPYARPVGQPGGY